MAAQDSSRVSLLEEEIRNLTEELVQCQADKDFVWSLWKRLQGANPDLAQAVGLVVEREKQKAEIKDRKILHILQVKDAKIQELEEQVTRQQRLVDDVAQRKVTVDQELAELHRKLKEKSQELEEQKEQQARGDKEQRQTLGLLEETKGDLEKLRREVVQQTQEKFILEARVQALEHELRDAQLQATEARSRCGELAVQLSARDGDLAERDQQFGQLGRELQEARALCQQNEAHAGEQAQLIVQLEGLHQDAQRLLRTQEEAHAADSAAQQKLYSELSSCFEALKASECQLRQNHASLTAQLCQKEQVIRRLQTRLLDPLAAPAAPCSQTRQTNSMLFEGLQTEPCSQECPIPMDPPASMKPIQSHHMQPGPQRHQDAPVQRSRSLSPASRRQSKRGVGPECRVRDLEELLRLKTEENEELRRAHEKRQQRLQLVQTCYKKARERLQEAEDALGWTQEASRRPELRQLRQEDSDAVWNELAYVRRQNRKLLAAKISLEEELDLLRVQSAMERTALQEFHLCLRQECQELRSQAVEVTDVTESEDVDVPGESFSERMERSSKKVEQLERKLDSLEREVAQLGMANQELGVVNRALQESLDHARMQAVARLEAAQARTLAEREVLEAHIREQGEELDAWRKREAQARRERGQARRHLLRLRQELGILRAAQSRRVKARAVQRCRHGPRLLAPSVDDWEDVSRDSDTEEKYSDSLNTPQTEKSSRPQTPPHQPKSSGYTMACPCREGPAKHHSGTLVSKRPGVEPPQQRGRWGKRGTGLSWPALQRRIISLQQQVAALLADRRTAQRSAQELREANAKMTSQLHSLTQRVQMSKQTAQKLSADLSALEQQKTSLERELEQWRQHKFHSRTPGQQATSPPDRTLESEVKQLQTRLKSSCNEAAKFSSANRALKAELQEKEERMKELQEKVSHLERDMNMKRQLTEDLKSRMKILQDNKRSHKETVEDLERKLKSLSEDSTNRKAFIDSLKQRLGVATKEKREYEASNKKLRDDLDKKGQRVEALQARLEASQARAEALQAQLAEREQTLAEVEEAAERHMRGLAEQSTEALEGLRKKMSLAQTQQEQLCVFVKMLASEILKDAQDVKAQLRKRKRRNRRSMSRGQLSRPSLMRAQSIAASILNVSQADLEDILDTDEEYAEEVRSDMKKDRDWLGHIMKVLQQQIPNAAVLMDAMLAKMKERKVLTEELASLREDVSETV